jgi:hypothetical protein
MAPRSSGVPARNAPPFITRMDEAYKSSFLS